jgi:hypothetical protein
MKESLVVKGLRWFSPSVFELSLDRAGVPFVPGDCLALFGADGRVSRPYSIASGNSESALRFLIRRMPGGEVSDFLAGVHRGAGGAGQRALRLVPARRPGRGNVRSFSWPPGPGWRRLCPTCAARSRCARPPSSTGSGRRPIWWTRTGCVRRRVRNARSRGRAAPHCFHGRITGLFDFLPLDAGHDYYLCGLDTMIDELTARLEGRGIPLARIHRECFFNATFDR